MATIGEIMAEAEVVTHEQTVMYDHELLSDIKCLTVEELYVRLDRELDAIDVQKLPKWSPEQNNVENRDQGILKQLSNKETILCYLCELYRRNIVFYGTEWVDYGIVICKGKYQSHEGGISSSGYHLMQPNDLRSSPSCCEKCRVRTDIAILSKKESMDLHEQTISAQYWKGFNKMKPNVKTQLTKLRKIRELQIACLKKPNIYEEINDLMDSILDTNGNKISEFKDYLTPEHYRLIRSGVDVKEIKDPDVLLQSLKKMNKIEKI